MIIEFPFQNSPIMKILLLLPFLISSTLALAQSPIDLSDFDKKGGATAAVKGDVLEITWPTGETEKGKVLIDLEKGKPLFGSIQISKEGALKEIANELDPVFILTVGKRDLTKKSGWNIFFDKTAYLPYEAHSVKLEKRDARVTSQGSRTKVIVSDVKAGEFSGSLEITFYNGSPLLNVAAVMSTERNSVAIIYDAGLVSKKPVWKEIFWADPQNYVQSAKVDIAA